ncbi:MAG: HNH endonuclease signature motif containing protein [Bacteroidetes bacterium]|nr:HNH endonuclease signature motif containing protein [Bacteroidota bacterium]
MKNIYFILLLFLITIGSSFAQKRQTYKSKSTTYYSNQTYKTTGQPKVKRSKTAKKEFLESKGYKRVPNGYQVDHVIPLSKGGTDKPTNMQLITTQEHKGKTTNERRTNSTYSHSSYNSTSTYSTPSYNTNLTKTIYSGSKGGQFYINRNGNKTYVKRK